MVLATGSRSSEMGPSATRTCLLTGALLATGLVLGMSCDSDETNPAPSAPSPDAAEPSPVSGAPAGAPCDDPSDCAGGVCLGAPGQPQEGNPRFVGGYCTALGCRAESQEGCGPDEWCIDGGFDTFCVEMCSKADGLTCERADHGCFGLGLWGGCFSRAASDCDPRQKGSCGDASICVRVGFKDEDRSLGRCASLCDPMAPSCPSGDACYYIRRYNTAFCTDPGATAPEDPCSCDKCCEPGYACTPDLDGAGKHCKPVCVVGRPCGEGGVCRELEANSPWGGCVLPGSAGTHGP